MDGCNLSEELRQLNTNVDEVTNAFLVKINQRVAFSDGCVHRFLELLGGTPVKARSKNVTMITQWTNLRPVEKRKYFFMKKAQLVSCCVAELGGSKTSYEKHRAEQLIDLLVQHRDVQLNANPTPALTATPIVHPLSQALIKQIISLAVLKPLTGGDRQSTRIGLDNEEMLLKRLLAECNGGSCKILLPQNNNQTESLNISEVYRPGLVRQSRKHYVKSSIDALGVLVGSVDGTGAELVGIEIKTRVSLETTRSAEINIRATLQRYERFVKIGYTE